MCYGTSYVVFSFLKVDLLTFVDVRSSKIKLEEQFKYEVRLEETFIGAATNSRIYVMFIHESVIIIVKLKAW